MARAAFLMDKLMTRVGLSGKSFVPLMSSFACAIPGVMATRVIENRRDRLTTMLVAPLMSCSARQPVYLLLIAAFIPAAGYLGGWIQLQGLMLFAMTSLGALVAIPIAWILKKTFFKGETPPFVMELPTYKWPSPRIVLNRVYDQGKAFVVRAGTLIFATTIVVWAAGYFPGDHREADALQVAVERMQEELTTQIESRQRLDTELAEWQEHVARPDLFEDQRAVALEQIPLLEQQVAALDAELKPLNELVDRKNAMEARLLEQSALGRLGHFIEPAVKPLGWDWKIGVGVIASFPAREVIIAALGTIYSLGSDVNEESSGLQAALKNSTWPDGRPVYNIPVALSVMVFFALCAQCASTLMVIKRETNSWRWPLFTFTYMTLLAYVAAFVVYQGARLLLG
jgi:ferrous iron transport protein B